MSIFTKALELLRGKQKEKELQEQLKKKEEELAQVNEQLVETELDLNLAKIALEPLKNCKNKVIYNVNSKSVTIIDCNNDSFSGYVEADVIEKLKTATTEEIIVLLTPTKIEEKGSDFDVEKEEKEIVKLFLGIFEGVDDFEVVGNSLFFKNIRSVEIPSLVAARFIELIEKHRDPVDEQIQTGYLEEDEEYQSLKAFTLKLLLNPIEESRNDTLTYIKNFNVKLTNTGNIVMFRRIVSVGIKNKSLVEFISKQYLKIKSWKKAPKNYNVHKNNDNNYFLMGLANNEHQGKNDTSFVGNLLDLYNNLPKMKENRYTDDYSKTYDIKIGAIYKIREEDIDLNKNGSCGGSLHVTASSKVYDYSCFGDTPVCCIVNPMHIYKLDSGCSGKIGVKQMFIAAITSQDEEGNYEDIDNQSLVNFDEIYHNETLHDLQKSLINKSLSTICISNVNSDINLKELSTITKILKNRVIKF